MGSVPVHVDVVSESEHTRVVRLRLPGGETLIRKEPLGPDREERVSHEVDILRRLSDVGSVAQLTPEQPDGGTILLEDIHGSPLAGIRMPFDINRIVAITLELARVVASVHQHGVIHCDVNPGNILIGEDGRSPYLVDFALAMTVAEVRPEFAHPNEIIGTLPYLAPEQTGRTGRSVDRRADLYALGATMYELATGRPPFGTGDPLRLIHDHLARAPVPPAAVNTAVPQALSDIVMHLLAKEPDNRYQTAEGLIHDLQLVRDGARDLRVGEEDVPLRLTEPSSLVARDREIDVLRSAFDEAVAGSCRGVVISGPSGVGKSALIDELRPIVTAGEGWFTSGRFDRFRKDQDHEGVTQALRGLGRLLLAEPDDALIEIRQRLLHTLRANAGTAAAVLPEFGTLLKVSPEPGDPLTGQVRAHRTALEILRAVASPKRPVVLVVDNLQWAGNTAVGLLDQLLTGDEEVEGLLTVVAYRDDGVDETAPLAPLLERWRRHPGQPEQLQLSNLGRDDLAAMVGEMLHASAESVTGLVDPIFPVTNGNPYETIELLSGLRREGLLRPTASGWWWDPAAIDRRLARQNVTQVMRSRVDAMPVLTRRILEAIACLGAEVQLPALQTATALSTTAVQQRLGPALDDGLLVMVSGLRAVRFHHDRLRDIVLSGITPARLPTLRLRLARRLVARPELFAVAAEQYLPVVDFVRDPKERRHAASLLRQAAGQSMWIGDSLPAERMLAAAVGLVDDPQTLIDLNTARHAALFRLGRLGEADEVYQAIVGLSSDAYQCSEVTRVQISSLTNRNRAQEAIGLGLNLLRRLGWEVPHTDDLHTAIDRGLDWSLQWITETSEADDLRRPDVSDPDILSPGALISGMMPACFFRDQKTMAWLALTAARTWAERGPARTLIGIVGHLPWALVSSRQAYRSGHRLMRRLLAVGEERAFEPDLSQTRFLYALGLSPWFDRLEDAIGEATRAREGLVRGGDLQLACYTFCVPVYAPEFASTVDEYAAEVDAALAFAKRTGNEHAAGLFEPYRWLVAALRGEPAAADAAEMVDRLTEPLAAPNANVARALAAAIFDDPESLARHSSAAMALRHAVESTYPVWQAHLVRAIALADQIRSSPDDASTMAELDDITRWVAQRAADAPMNFRHMQSLIEAERAWAARDFRTAIHAFDSALRSADHRPWHRAFIAERSARFMLSYGLDHAGWSLLVEARELYRMWGARAKVDQLDRAYPSLEVATDPSTAHTTRRSSITAGAIDMVGILAASRALSSETSVGGLRSKVVEVVSGMTGATDVGLLLWNGEQRRWLAATEEGSTAERVPDSVVRYVDRTREPVIVGDAVRDDRFSRDPYFRDLEVCSVLAVPVLSRGKLQAVLLLENHLMRDAFPAERLEAVLLVASQLAVSLDNALVYTSLERKVTDRTRQLALANERLAHLSITDPLTGLANRRRMAEYLQEEWQRARRTQAPLSVAMVDIDHFKQFNDAHGHRAGDRCLQHIATQLIRTVRDTDLVARYGGEEFAIIMSDTDATAGRDAAERVRVAIIDLHEQLTDDRVVTASIGVATLHDAERQSTDQVIEQADAALYRAKRTGRNRVCSGDLDGAPNA